MDELAFWTGPDQPSQPQPLTLPPVELPSALDSPTVEPVVTPFVEPPPTPVVALPTPVAGSEQQEPGVSGARQEILVRAEKRRILAQTFLSQADDAFARGDPRGAATLYADALQLNPESRQARDGLRRCESALAGTQWDTSSAEDRLTQEQLRWYSRRVRVEGLVRDGDRAMSGGDFAKATQLYRSAQMALSASPGLAGGQLDLFVVGAKLKDASGAATALAQDRRAANRMAAEAEAAASEVAREEYARNRVRTLFSEADTAFSQGFYDNSVTVLDALLDLDPRNVDALALREVANEAWHGNRQRESDTSFREEWRRTFEELRHIAIPPRSIIEHDVDYWRDTVLTRKPLDRMAADRSVDPTEAAIQRALDETRIEPRFDNSIEEIADNLAAYTRVNFVVSRAVREDVDEDVKSISMALSRPMPVSRILRILEDLTQNEIQFVIRNGVVSVVSSEEALGNNVLNKYEVRDIVRSVRDFVGVDVNLSPSGGLEEVEEEMPEREATVLTEDDLLGAITENISPDIWDDTAFLSIENGTLIVNAPSEEQERISSLLNDLRESANVMVNIHVIFLSVEDSFLQDIGVDFRGLGDDSTAGTPGKGSNTVFDDFGSDPGSPGSPATLGTGNDSGIFFREASDNLNVIARTENLYDSGLGNNEGLLGTGGFSLQYTYLDDTEVELILRAVKKSERSEILTEPSLNAFNGQRATLTVANQVSYVGDFDVEIAQAAAIADPIVRVARDGVYLDMRPVVSSDRRFVYVEVRPTVATLLRPIPSFQTSLGTGSPVTLQLPELELQKIRTRVMVPDGGTLLLGGMKIVEQQDLDSGIPVLNRIPILSFFFSRKGEYESYRKLLILLTANIVMPEEFEPAILPGDRR